MNRLLVATALVSLLSTLACTAGSSLLDTCSGAYSCTDGTQTVSTELQNQGGACTAGQLTLNADGTVGGADGTTWDGDSQQFEICGGGSCITCTSSGGGSGDPTPPAPQSCVTSHEHSMQCTALDPYDGTSTSCEDNVDPSKCVDSSSSDYGGGCFFEDTYTRYTITTDCATYEAENPSLFQ